MNSIEIILYNPIQAHKVIADAWHLVKPELMSGNKVIFKVGDYEEHITTLQRKYYHGYILKEIARQAEVNGQNFNLETWKEHFRKTYLGVKRIKFVDPMTGRKKWRNERVSSEDLGVKRYNILIEKVTAFATTDLGVNFDETFESWTEENSV